MQNPQSPIKAEGGAVMGSIFTRRLAGIMVNCSPREIANRQTREIAPYFGCIQTMTGEGRRFTPGGFFFAQKKQPQRGWSKVRRRTGAKRFRDSTCSRVP